MFISFCKCEQPSRFVCELMAVEAKCFLLKHVQYFFTGHNSVLQTHVATKHSSYLKITLLAYIKHKMLEITELKGIQLLYRVLLLNKMLSLTSVSQ